MSTDSLYRRLARSKIECELGDRKTFLPLDVLEAEITREEIQALLSPKLFGLALNVRSRIPSKIVANAKKVFAILVLIGEPGAARSLLAEGLTDSHLPLSRNPTTEQEYKLVSRNGTVFHSFASWNERRVNDFLENQWTVLAPVLDNSGEDVTLEPKYALPIKALDIISCGPYSIVYRGELHPAHQKGIQVASGDRINIAIKEFNIMNALDFVKERDNLTRIRELKHPHLIQHYATFNTGDGYYIVFPWAEGGDLRDFWNSNDAVNRNADLALWCLRQMHGLAGALRALHSINCRHGDLKPEHILCFHRSNSPLLVVSGFNIARVHRHSTMMRRDPSITRATTPAYEAPETITRMDLPRSRRYDIWSLGCIFLEFTVWFLHSLKSIDEFRTARSDSTQSWCYFYELTSRTKAEVHPAVLKTLGELRDHPRCKGDTALAALLSLIAEGLLRIDVEDRYPADKVHEELMMIVQRAEIDPNYRFNQAEPSPSKPAVSRQREKPVAYRGRPKVARPKLITIHRKEICN